MAAIRFAVIGIDHGHIYDQCRALLRGGAEFVSFHAPDPALATPFAAAFPMARAVADPREILESPDIQIVASAGIPAERAPLGLAVMHHGKDYFVDKPGFTTLDQLAEVRRVRAETKRIYAVYFSERFESRATVHALDLVRQGAIGRVLQTTGLGPHRPALANRPPWFFERARYGGILADIASHQMDQFLAFTNSASASVAFARIGNLNHPDRPEFEDFGEIVLTGEHGTAGYVRVDWFTPDGLPVWGDGRFMILGTEGYIELRKYCDIAGRPGGDHLFLVDRAAPRHIDCQAMPLPFGPAFIADIRDRTETAQAQAHCFLASELALAAEAQATRLEP
jgi:predicted dehydrogenase